MSTNLQVLVVTRSKTLPDLVEKLVEGPAEFHVTARPPFPKGMDLVVVEKSPAGRKLLEEFGAGQGKTDVLLLNPAGKFGKVLQDKQATGDISKLAYREATHRAGSLATRDYLKSLLARHDGNVTNAAKAAEIERESLHRLIKRHGLKAADFRRTQETHR